MTRHLPTLSRSALAAECLHWLTLEHDESTGEAAARGTRIHAAVAALLDPRAPRATCDEQATAEAIATALRSLGAVPQGVELTFALDPLETRVATLGQHLGRDYSSAPEGWWVGTADDAWLAADGVVEVADVKTGRRENVEPAATNKQLRSLALAACGVYGASEARVHLVFADGTVDSAELDEMTLAGHAALLRGLERRRRAGLTAPQPGTHCREMYCPARAACQVTTLAVAEVLPALVGAVGSPVTSVEDATARVLRLRTVADAWKRAEEAEDAALRAWVQENGPVPLGNGKERALVTATRETVQWTEEQKAAAREAGQVKVSTYETWKDRKVGR